MEILTPEYSGDSATRIGTIVVSSVMHIFIISAILVFPFFGKSNHDLPPVLDITLYDFPGGDIVPGMDTGLDSPSEMKTKPVELMDPSDAELKRMKRRSKKDWTPVPKKDSEFVMRSGVFPGGKGTTSGSLKLDSADFPFMYYLSMLKNRISENWIPPFGSIDSEEPKRVVVKFWVQRSGAIIEPAIEESSGDDALDQSALRAIIVSNPFPPLPATYADAALGVHFGFRCEL
jgi:TonB family protein